MKICDVIPIAVDLHLNLHYGPTWEVEPFIQREGWLITAKASIDTPFGIKRSTIIVAVSDHYELFGRHVTKCLFHLPASAPHDPQHFAVPDELLSSLEVRYRNFAKTIHIYCLQQLEMKKNIEREIITEYQLQYIQFVRNVRFNVRRLQLDRKRCRTGSPERLSLEARLKSILTVVKKLKDVLRVKLKKIRSDFDELRAEVLSTIKSDGNLSICSLVRWRAVDDRSNKIADFVSISSFNVHEPTSERELLGQSFYLAARRAACVMAATYNASADNSEAPVFAQNRGSFRTSRHKPWLDPPLDQPRKQDQRLVELKISLSALKRRRRKLKTYALNFRYYLKDLWIYNKYQKKILIDNLYEIVHDVGINNNKLKY